MSVGKWLMLAGLAWTFASARVNAANAVLTCVADTALFEQNTNHNLGGMTFLPVGRTGSGARARALYKFTVADTLPAGSVIRDVTLELEVVGSNPSPQERPFSLHRVLASWGEGNKSGGAAGGGVLGSPATTGEATWYSRFHPNLPWSQPGGQSNLDYVSTPSSTEDIPGEGRYFFTSAAMVSDVQKWLDNPGTNFGWLVKIHDESVTGTSLRFASREDLTAGPTLRVQYDPPGQTQPRLMNGRLVGGMFQFDFHADANRMYFAEYTTNFGQTVTRWTVFQLVEPGPARIVTVSDTPGQENRFYRVYGF